MRKKWKWRVQVSEFVVDIAISIGSPYKITLTNRIKLTKRFKKKINYDGLTKNVTVCAPKKN